jgi:hypothetical protein
MEKKGVQKFPLQFGNIAFLSHKLNNFENRSKDDTDIKLLLLKTEIYQSLETLKSEIYDSLKTLKSEIYESVKKQILEENKDDSWTTINIMS